MRNKCMLIIRNSLCIQRDPFNFLFERCNYVHPLAVNFLIGSERGGDIDAIRENVVGKLVHKFLKNGHSSRNVNILHSTDEKYRLQINTLMLKIPWKLLTVTFQKTKYMSVTSCCVEKDINGKICNIVMEEDYSACGVLSNLKSVCKPAC